ncbi:MAG: hypothetical protein A2Z72_03100 [Omnitrophica bacterium RBG_13_46_9]|nr:MAG: hypothetical protein A2Z72_03100 [Omnitrophica bacterium RBG_13_46_9]
MSDKKAFNAKFFLIMILSAILLTRPDNAFAGHRPSKRSPSEHHYRSISALPRGCISIAIGGLKFYYREGVFHRRGMGEYVVVNPPRGAAIAALPGGCQKLIVSGDTYYYYNGAYYRSCPSGYIVVPAPVVYDPKAVLIEPSSTVVSAQKLSAGTVVLNIPNSDGSYVPVVLEKSGDGYIGPQGEYYPGNPKIEQLQVLYGK